MLIQKGTRIHKVATETSEFMNSKVSWIIFGGLILLISVTQLILYGTGVIQINGIGVGDTGAWKYWMSISLSGIASMLVQLSFILTSRHDRRFIYVVLTVIAINVSLSIIFNLYFSLIKLALVAGIQLTMFFRWKNPKNKEVKAMNGFLVWTIIIVIAGATLGVGYGMNLTEIEYAHWIVPYLDFFGMAIAILANILVMLGYKEGHLTKMLSNIAGATNSIIYGQWIAIFSVLVSMTNQLLSYIKWSLKYSEAHYGG